MSFLKSRFFTLFILSFVLASTSFYTYKQLFKPKRTYLTVIGPLNLAEGIGRQSVELIDALKEECSINFIPVYKNKADLGALSKKTKEIVLTKNKTLGKVVIYEDLVWQPKHKATDYLKSVAKEDQIRIAYSMLEYSHIPQEWVILLNAYFDAVVVPDPFLVDVYKKSGVQLPVFVVPLGLDLKDLLKEPMKEKRGSPMVFANLSSCDNRKNHIALVRAFHKAFGNDENVVLRINARKGNPKDIEALKAEIERTGATNIWFSELALEKDAYVKFFKTIDCYVSLSKGEGFSIQPREAMALGIPVIATDNTGQSTICRSGLIKAIQSKTQEPALFFGYKPCGFAWNCDIEEAASAMRDIYEHYDLYLQSSAASRKWAALYDYPHLKPLYQSLVKPKQIILGTEDKVTAEGITTTSAALFEKYQKL